MSPFRCIILGAAGRDFHDFLTFFRPRPDFEVCCFTAEQIPFIDRRTFPAELAGERYPRGIPIHPESELEQLIAGYQADLVFLSYSDLSHEEVMHKACRAQAAGASFVLLGPRQTQLVSKLPVVSVTAVRTGAGKSPLSQLVATHLRQRGRRVGVVRHPMPYGDLLAQRCQRFASADDLVREACTVEEREEYEPYLEFGLTVYAGVDYAEILARVEQEADVLLWDGGNNDAPFYRPGLSIVVVDALRAADTTRYYPGETNLRGADVVVINKIDGAAAETLEVLRETVARAAPRATVIEAVLVIEVEDAVDLAGKRVLVVEDGPSVTHGGMPSGAGLVAATRYGAEVIDPRPHAVGTIAQVYEQYPHLGRVLPALGYSEPQRRELRATIAAAAPDLVLDASPSRLGRVLDLELPVARVRYYPEQRAGRPLLAIVDDFLDAAP